MASYDTESKSMVEATLKIGILLGVLREKLYSFGNIRTIL